MVGPFEAPVPGFIPSWADVLIGNPNQGVEPTWTYGPKCRLSWGFIIQGF